MRETFTRVAAELVQNDPRVAVVLADIGASSFEPSDRIVNLGIREQALIGTVAGMALSGLRPIAHSYTPFLVERPFEQIKLDLAHQDLGAILVSIGASFDAAAEGRTHQSPGDVALLSTLPEWTIQVPGHAHEVEVMLRKAATTDTRIYIRLAADTNHVAYPVTGNLTKIREGSAHGATVIAVGPMLDRVLEATRHLDATVVYASTVRPFDNSGLRKLVSGQDVVLVEPYLKGTSSETVIAALGDQPMRLLTIGVPNVEHRHYGTRHHHIRAHGLDAAGLKESISQFVDHPVAAPSLR